MSTEATVKDMQSLKSAIAKVRSDANDVERTSWMVVGHVDNNPHLIDVVSEGDSLEDMHKLLLDTQDTQIMYALVRLSSTIDMTVAVKFVYIKWLGDRVPAMLRGKIGVVHGSIETHFEPFHTFVEASSIEDITKEVLDQKLAEGSGTSNKVIEGSVEGMQVRGFTQHTVKAKVGAAPQRAPAGEAIEVAPSLCQALADVKDDTNPTVWVLGAFEDGNVKRPLNLVATGSGSIEEIRAHLEEDQIVFGLFRVLDVVDDIETVKFVFINWIGDRVKPMKKAKISTCKGEIESLYHPAHCTLVYSSKSEITTSLLMDKVTSASGSKSHVK